MSRDTTVIAFRQPEAIDDPMTEVVAREGARRMLAQVLIAEADSFVAVWKDLKLSDGRDRVVRHGHGRIAQSRPSVPEGRECHLSRVRSAAAIIAGKNSRTRSWRKTAETANAISIHPPSGLHLRTPAQTLGVQFRPF
jgi:hypothetical protein